MSSPHSHINAHTTTTIKTQSCTRHLPLYAFIHEPKPGLCNKLITSCGSLISSCCNIFSIDCGSLARRRACAFVKKRSFLLPESSGSTMLYIVRALILSNWSRETSSIFSLDSSSPSSSDIVLLILGGVYRWCCFRFTVAFVNGTLLCCVGPVLVFNNAVDCVVCGVSAFPPVWFRFCGCDGFTGILFSIPEVTLDLRRVAL